jgi:DNA-binding NarL/FixJ family response regulator
MNQPQRSILDLIDLAYQAATNPSAWEQVVRMICSESHAETAHIGFFRSSVIESSVWGVGLSESATKAYGDYFLTRDPITPTLVKNLPNLGMGTEESILDTKSLLKTEFHQDWAAPNGLRHCLVANIHRSPGLTVSLTIGRGKGAGSFHNSKPLLESLRILMPHLKRAAELQVRQETTNALIMDLESGFDAIGHCAILVDHDARLVHASRTAWTSGFDNGPLILAGGRVGIKERKLTDLLQQLIRRVALGESRAIPEILLLPQYAAGFRIVTIWPVPTSKNHPRQRAGRAMVVLKRSDRDTVRPDALMAQFKLTHAETEVLELLAKGLTVRAIAASRGTSLGTTRNQTKAIMSKLGVSRQVELIRLLASHFF